MVWIILVGALGGMCPTLLKYAIDLTQQNATIKDLNISIVVGIALFGLLGGILAGVWGEKNLKRVFYIGLGLPSLLTVATSHATEKKTTPAATAMFSPTRVFAATEAVPGRLLKTVLPNDIASAQPQAIFSTTVGEEPVAITNNTPIAVPPGALSVRIASSRGTSNAIALPRSPGALVTITIRADRNTWYGFQYAVGIHSDPYALAATLTDNNGRIDSFPVKHPIALGGGPETSLLVLQDDGTILSLANQSLSPFSTVGHAYIPIDIASTIGEGTQYALVTANSGSGLGSLLLLGRGSTVAAGLLPQQGRFTGVAADPSNHLVYAAHLPDCQIYVWSVTAKSLTGRRILAGVPKAHTLGAMTIDTSKQQLFVADPDERKVYRIALGQHPKVTMLAEALQEIRSMAMDEMKRVIYVGGGDKLTVVPTDALGERRQIAGTFREISGLAIDKNHELWVSDFHQGEVRKITP